MYRTATHSVSRWMVLFLTSLLLATDLTTIRAEDVPVGRRHPSGTFTEELKTSKEVYAWFRHRYRGEDFTSKMTLVLINRRGEKRTIEMLRFRQDKDGLVKQASCFLSPRDVRGTASLTVEQPGDDLQRMYFPSMRKHRRVSNADKGKAWLGTDMSNEDLRERDMEEWDYLPLKRATVEGHDCYFITIVPKSVAKSVYSKVDYWMRKDIREFVMGRYYDKKGRCVKQMHLRDYRKTMDEKGKNAVYQAMYMEMYNFKDKHLSLFITDKIAYNVGLKDHTFSPRFLERFPTSFKGGKVWNDGLKRIPKRYYAKTPTFVADARSGRKDVAQ